MGLPWQVVIGRKFRIRACGLSACWLLSVGNLMAGGVTVITHGFNGNVTDWVIPMAERMIDYPGFPGSEASCYVLEVTNRNGPATAVWAGGVKPNLSDSGEIFIKLDWSDIAGIFQASSDQVAEAAVNALIDPALISSDTGGRALAELPLHLIGHSRGSSVVTEMAERLGKRGIWVDQVTTLDPYPVSFFGDDPVRTWENVLYADNYWQDIGAGDPITGDPLSGAFNRELTNLNGGNGSSHSDVHLWYHGTVELTTPASDTQQTINSTMRSAWWTTAENEGVDCGFLFSRLGGGDRLSNFQPAGAGQIVDGYNRKWDLGAGVSSNRVSLSSNSAEWPSVILCGHEVSEAIPFGQSFDLDISYQAGATASGTVGCTVILDPDTNPWNGNEIEIDAGTLAKTGISNVGAVPISVSPGSTSAGVYFVGARLTDGTRSRVLYAASSVEISSDLPPPSIDRSTLVFEGGVMKFTVLGSPGQTLRILASPDLDDWSPIATQLMTSSTWEFIDPASASIPKRFYQIELVE